MYLLLLMLLGCPPTEEDTDDTADTAIDWTLLSDEEVVRGMISGAHPDSQIGLLQIAWSNGIPILTERGRWLFVLESQSGVAWSVAGDFNEWEPLAMQEADGLAWVEVEISDPEGQKYKFTHDELWVADRWARSFEYDEYGEASFVRPPIDRPRLDRWPDLEEQGLLPRDIIVHVPTGGGPWPVLYVQDGQNLFDPDAFWGGWQLQSTLADLPTDILLVGIHSTADRLDEYSHTTEDLDGYILGGRGDDYAALVQEDLRPHIEATYGSTGLDGVLGSSMGGLISLYIAHLYPEAFDFAGSMSGTLGWGHYGLENPSIEDLYAEAGVRDPVLYLDSGGSDGGDGCQDPDQDGLPEDDPNDADNYCVTRQFADRMASVGYTWNENLLHWHDADAEHNEAAWAGRVHLPMEAFLSITP
ncbi:MAG: hypothetical protein JRJ84_17245 [Deltaproteobacteria bacterium]|nr:hypothetical protein [Deltaproteobacteria bacterium]